MKQNLLVFSVICLCPALYNLYYADMTQTRLTSNLEALEFQENKVIGICEGNVGTCAKGFDENTGHDFIIHGIAKIL